jgi:glycine/D-amino acid oxidase-like deaminating enzyme/nitrite reductase/ring-hydroxylating ferredoxin subunit
VSPAPLWGDRGRAATPTPVDGHHDVVVVGAGLTGLTTALLLARAGRSVLVVEARRVGAGTTGASTAKVSALQGTRLSAIRSRHSPEVVRQYVAAQQAGVAWLRSFCEAGGVAVEDRTASSYATTDRGAALVEREHRVAREAGLPTRYRPDLPLPFDVTAAVELEDQLQVDPVELLDGLAREAADAGVVLAEGSRVLGVRGSGLRRVETETGTATAGTVVIATNMPMLDRGGHFARLRPVRSYLLGCRADDLHPLTGMYLSVDGPTRSLRDVALDGGRYLLVGGEGHPTGRETATGRRLDALRAWTAEHYPTVTETHAWSAQDYLPTHELPLAGPVLPGDDGLLMAGGYAKWGFTNAVAASLALTARVQGASVDWAEAMTAWSRRELGGVASLLRHNGEVGVEMLRGWVAPLTRLGRLPAEGEGLVRVDGARPPTAVSRVDDEVRAVSAVCPHLGGIVRWNEAERSWDCPLHGSRFSPDGAVLEGPATCGLGHR